MLLARSPRRQPYSRLSGGLNRIAPCARAHWRARPCSGQQEQDRGRVQQQRHDEDEPPQHHLVGLAEQNGEIFHRTKISLDGATLAFNGGPPNFQVGEDLRLDRELVGKVVALGL